MYNKGLCGEDRRGVGAFYFDNIAQANVAVNNIFITALDPKVYTFSEITLDFIGIPTIGTNPLRTEFTVTLSLLSNSTLKFKNYEWYFDYDRYPLQYTTSTNTKINHVFEGNIGKTYSIKCVARFEDDSTFEVYKQNYIMLLGQALPIRFGIDVKTNFSKFLPESLR